MVKISIMSDGTVEVSGKTYDHKAIIKTLGARWNNERKCWVGIKNTKEHIKTLKSLTTKRRCGHCGEEGHFKPKCEKYHEERKRDIKMKAEALWHKRPVNYERLKHTGFCHCMFEQSDYGYKDFSVLMPRVCTVCSSWCCDKARPMDDIYSSNINFSRFVCPCHGDVFQQIMNDTSGT